MKIKANAKGVYYARLTGSNPINLKTKNLTEAKRLAKEAKLEEIEFAAKANLLTAEAVQRLSAGGKVTGTSALDRWRNPQRWRALHRLTNRRAFRSEKRRRGTTRPGKILAVARDSFICGRLGFGYTRASTCSAATGMSRHGLPELLRGKRLLRLRFTQHRPPAAGSSRDYQRVSATGGA